MCVSDRRFFVDKNNGFVGVWGEWGGDVLCVHIRLHVCVGAIFFSSSFVGWKGKRHKNRYFSCLCVVCGVVPPQSGAENA